MQTTNLRIIRSKVLENIFSVNILIRAEK